MELTRHAKERYAERIMGKGGVLDINSFIVSNEEKIQKDIEAMITYGKLIFKGKPIEYNDKQPVKVYLCDTWILILDDKKDKVITLYKIDLGLGEDFNNEYVGRLMGKLDEVNQELASAYKESDEKKKEYQAIVDENTAMINEYRGYIKNLEALNKDYQSLIDGIHTNNSKAELNLRQCIGVILGKKVF